MNKISIATLGVVFLLNYPFINAYSQETINPNDLIKIGNAEFSVEGATKIDAKTAKELHDKGTGFIDARDEDFFRLGHIPGAILINVKTDLTEASLGEHVEKDQIGIETSGLKISRQPGENQTWARICLSGHFRYFLRFGFFGIDCPGAVGRAVSKLKWQ